MSQPAPEKAPRGARSRAPIVLPPASPQGRMSVTKALELRRTTRKMSGEKLPMETLSNLLFAAAGVNRKEMAFDSVGRTAGSASNSQEIEVYVALEEGTYLYDPLVHQLLPAVSGDLRRFALARGQRQVGDLAPVRLIYVVDLDKLEDAAGFDEPGLMDPEIQKSYYYVDTGLIAANVYLFAASAGLAAWFHNCDISALTSKLRLGDRKRVLFAQTVGLPATPTGKGR